MNKEARHRILAEQIEPNEVNNQKIRVLVNRIVNKFRKEEQASNSPSPLLNRQKLKELEEAVLERVDGIRANISLRIIAEIIVENMLIPPACPNERKDALVDAITAVLETYGSCGHDQ